MRIVVLVGLPGSGKSKWLADRGVCGLSSDHLRDLLADDETDQTIHERVFQSLRYLLRQRLAIHRPTTWIDATNLTRQERAPYIGIGKSYGCLLEAAFFDIPLEVELNGAVVSRGNARGLYWTMPQQLAHATSNGASVRSGDLMASGTISGSQRGSEGSLIELTWNGQRPVKLEDGERTFLEDGDEVVLRGDPLGEVRGRILPS